MALDSARSLALKHLDKANGGDGGQDPPSKGNLPLVSPGDMKLYSYYAPGLIGGTYTLGLGQTVDVPGEGSKDLSATSNFPKSQQFEVVAPRFVIPPEDFHSTYPPAGHADQPNVLPHLVFTDPHLPWERRLDKFGGETHGDEMPWLAVSPFDCTGPNAELKLSSDQVTSIVTNFTSTSKSNVSQLADMTLRMTLKEYFALDGSSLGSSKVHVPPYSQDPDWSSLSQDTGTIVPVIFLSGSLFANLFTKTSAPSSVDLTDFQYCAHVRNINTMGMADSGVQDRGLFSILHSRRTGPVDIAFNTPARPQTCHLLSLEFIDGMSIPPAGDLVALISLYSWNYLCQPPLSVNFVDSMRNIGAQIKSESCMLRCSDTQLKSIDKTVSLLQTKSSIDQSKVDKAKTRLLKRLEAGYTMVRHRVSSGEVTTAWTRSPLVPEVTKASNTWPKSSTTGQDYLILDPQTGTMDVSYSVAWQLGKTMAASDLGFVAALMRIRGSTHRAGAAAGDRAVLDPVMRPPTRRELMTTLASTVDSLHTVSSRHSDIEPPGLKSRWSLAAAIPPPGTPPARDPSNPVWKSAFQTAVMSCLETLSKSLDQKAPSNDISSATSTDWAFVRKWIMDKMYLASIPWHYLITDPAHLPPESIRFFVIDNVWMDCLIDGALSVANHLARDDDVIRDCIKAQMNLYLKTDQGKGKLAFAPQVPRYGFLLRSEVVHIFPDLQIEVPFATTDPNTNRLGAPILLQKNLRQDTVLVLLDRLPDSGTIDRIRISQPPHQQRFSLGDRVDADEVEFLFMKVYKKGDHSDNLHEFGDPHVWKRTGETKTPVYDWNSRCIAFDGLEAELLSGPTGLIATLPDQWPAGKESSKLTSALTGIQLNDTIKYLEIMPAAAIKGDNTPRHIWRGSENEPLQLHARVMKAAPGTRRSAFTRTASKNPPLNALPTVTVATTPAVPRAAHKTLPRSLSLAPEHLRTLSKDPPGRPVERFSAVAGSKPAAVHPPTHDTAMLYAIYPSTIAFDRNHPLRWRRSPFISTNRGYAPDLIFSIQRGNTISGIYLKEIRLRIPTVDGKNPHIDGIALVPADSMPCSGATMLSNQRWVVHVDHASDALNLRVIPRSTTGAQSMDTHKRDLSFRLNEIEVAGPMGDKIRTGICVIQVTEFYVWPDGRGGWLNGGQAQMSIQLQLVNGEQPAT